MVNRTVILGFVVCVSACSTDVSLSSLNPFSSSDELGRSEIDLPDAGPAIEWDRVSDVTSVEIGISANGVIVQATGVAALQGYYQGTLRLIEGNVLSQDGYIQLEFVARPPESAPIDSGTPTTRTLTAAQYLPQDTIGTAVGVRILAAGNSLDHLL